MGLAEWTRQQRRVGREVTWLHPPTEIALVVKSGSFCKSYKGAVVGGSDVNSRLKHATLRLQNEWRRCRNARSRCTDTATGKLSNQFSAVVNKLETVVSWKNRGLWYHECPLSRQQKLKPARRSLARTSMTPAPASSIVADSQTTSSWYP